MANQLFEPRTIMLLREWAEGISHQEDLFLNDAWLSSRGITGDDLARLTSIIHNIVLVFTEAEPKLQRALIVFSAVKGAEDSGKEKP